MHVHRQRHSTEGLRRGWAVAIDDAVEYGFGYSECDCFGYSECDCFRNAIGDGQPYSQFHTVRDGQRYCFGDPVGDCFGDRFGDPVGDRFGDAVRNAFRNLIASPT